MSHPPLALAAAVAAVLASCNPFSYTPVVGPPDMTQVLDECTAAPAGRSCVTLHLHGADPIDTVQVDSIFELGGQQVARRIVSRNPGGAVKPPIALGVILTLNAGESVQMKVVARNGNLPVAIGSADFSGLRPGQHAAATVNLLPAAQTRCFNGVLDGEERDVDCGWIGECQLCTVGNVCLLAQDCADSACLNSGGNGYRCQ